VLERHEAEAEVVRDAFGGDADIGLAVEHGIGDLALGERGRRGHSQALETELRLRQQVAQQDLRAGAFLAPHQTDAGPGEIGGGEEAQRVALSDDEALLAFRPFGTQFVGAIHGWLLTAWSVAGIVGPTVVNFIREAEIAAGVPRESVYDVTMYILAGMLVLGLICNLLVRPLADHWFMKPEEVAALQARLQHDAPAPAGAMGIGQWQLDTTSVLAWLAVGIPIAWGVWITLKGALVLFQ